MAELLSGTTDSGRRTKERKIKVSRLQKLRDLLDQNELDALIIDQSENRRYLSGFTGSAGWLIVSQNSALLAVDFRYTEQAKKESAGFEVVLVKGEVISWLSLYLSEHKFRKVGFEAEHVSLAAHQRFSTKIKDNGLKVELVPTSGLVESIRAVKEPGEIELIEKAVQLADAAYGEARAILRPGLTEAEVAWKLEKFLREKGSQAVPFEIIVTSGPNSAQPHAKPSAKTIVKNEPVVIDLGARVSGYCCDLTRTFFLGDTDKTFSKIYDIVLGAQLTALSTIVSGMNGDQADRLARTVIEQANYGEAFGHGLGHGVGLQTHESPRLGPNSTDVLVDRMVFTLEPGIYVPGWGGIRIEDTVVMENGKARTLTRADKKAYIS
ncbi:MAG TPA: Xaa-Pro peptidase family protein [Dehalococcoidia bacterium]